MFRGCGVLRVVRVVPWLRIGGWTRCRGWSALHQYRTVVRLAQVAYDAGPMGGSRWLGVVVVASLVMAGCGSSDPNVLILSTTTAGSTVNGVCTVQGLDYTTSLSSCEASNELGRKLAIEISNPNASDLGGDIIFISICSGLQGTTKMTYSFDTDLQLAKALDAQGVCPGDLSMLVKK